MVGSHLETAEIKGALRDLIILADDAVAKRKEELHALRASGSDAQAITALETDIDRISTAAEQLRPLTN